MYKTTEKQRQQSREWQARNPWRFLWLAARRRAKATGRSFSITVSDIAELWPADGKCPALGIDLASPAANRGTTKQGPRPDSVTLDRIDNALGYEKGNIALISWKANRIKEAASPEELAAVARWALRKSLF